MKRVLTAEEIDKVEDTLQSMEWGNLTDREHDIIISIEEQYRAGGFKLSDKQLGLLDTIFQESNERF